MKKWRIALASFFVVPFVLVVAGCGKSQADVAAQNIS